MGKPRVDATVKPRADGISLCCHCNLPARCFNFHCLDRALGHFLMVEIWVDNQRAIAMGGSGDLKN